MRIRFLFLFIVLVLWIIINPLVSTSRAVEGLLSTLVLLSMVYSVSHTGRGMAVTLALGIPYAIVGWLNVFFVDRALQSLFTLLTAVFFGYLIYMALRFIRTTSGVTADSVLGAICIYLLIGLAWTSLYRLVTLFQWNSFTRVMSYSNLLYYSFITLTAVGDGKFKPISSTASTLTILEAITGVLYIATIIALIVGAYSSSLIIKRQGQADEDGGD
ncbi:MAG: ion channel [Actinobacteria bacterium]|nr:ion channel [Actinomycetota bacterium]